MVNYRRPESILVLIYTSNHEVLLLKRIDPFPYWQSVTGSMRVNESEEDAAQRELREETGLKDEGFMVDYELSRSFEIDPRWQHRYHYSNKVNIEHEFHYLLAERSKITLDPKEHSQYKWLPIDIAIKEVWSWTNKEALERLAARL